MNNRLAVTDKKLLNKGANQGSLPYMQIYFRVEPVGPLKTCSKWSITVI